MSAKTAQDSVSRIIHSALMCGNCSTLTVPQGSEGSAQSTTFLSRFWSKVNRRAVSECWPWLASSHKKYGKFNITRRRKVYAHRLAYELAVGPIPAGQLVLHRCDNPPCCNPDHLFLGTHSDNAIDAYRKGRRTQPIPHRWGRKSQAA